MSLNGTVLGSVDLWYMILTFYYLFHHHHHHYLFNLYLLTPIEFVLIDLFCLIQLGLFARREMASSRTYYCTFKCISIILLFVLIIDNVCDGRNADKSPPKKPEPLVRVMQAWGVVVH